MSHFDNVRTPDIAFNQTADMLQGPRTYTFPPAIPLHKRKIEMKEESNVIIPDKPELEQELEPDPYPEDETILQKLMDWLSKPLNLSLFVSIVALLLVILF